MYDSYIHFLHYVTFALKLDVASRLVGICPGHKDLST